MLKQKAPQFVVTFFTTAEAMATERTCRSLGLDGRLISAPRNVTADCGIAWCTAPELGERTLRALAGAGIEIAGACEVAV